MKRYAIESRRPWSRAAACFLITALFVILMLLGLSACAKSTAKDAVIDFGSNQASGSEQSLSPLKRNEDDQPAGLASGLYTFTPDAAHTQPVQVTIPITQHASADHPDAKPFLGIGRTYLFDDGTKETTYQFIPATVENEMARASFIPAEYRGERFVRKNSAGAPSTGIPFKENLELGFFWCSTTFRDGGHFIVYFPAVSKSLFLNMADRRALLDDLESVYRLYLDNGYDYQRRTAWPMDVTITKLAEEGVYEASYWNGADGSISLNQASFASGYQSDRIKPILVHEFFHFVQMNYEKPESDSDWFDDATATYFEGQERKSIPSIVAQYEERIFSGVIPVEDTAQDGYARMPLIQFLAQTRTEDIIRQTYERVRGGATWDAALPQTLGQPETWAGDFYESLVHGKVGYFSPYTLHTNLTSGKMDKTGKALPIKVPADADLEAQYQKGETPVIGQTSLTLAPCGAQLIALTTDYATRLQLADDAKPMVKASGNTDVRVLTVLNKDAKTLPATQEGVMLTDFKALSDKGVLYLIVVTSLDANRPQDCTVKVELPKAAPAGITTYGQTHTSILYNGSYQVPVQFNLSCDHPFLVVQENRAEETLVLQIQVDATAHPVRLDLSATVGDPTFTDVKSGTEEAGYHPTVQSLYWDINSLGKVDGTTASVEIPQGAYNGDSASLVLIIEDVNDQTGDRLWGGSGKLVYLSIITN